ncbi:hypothetical protein T4B_13039 [Trichinella pseudospiralis]|uniref:Uncharacterized protein n=1 Tax=Trichinella pseudospiralis TaxID=6337 RepID=A0A0V1GRP8_TRIPS|nr:hypothetical protein T4B_13039 [Trichinella pseudospiralis]
MKYLILSTLKEPKTKFASKQAVLSLAIKDTETCLYRRKFSVHIPREIHVHSSATCIIKNRQNSFGLSVYFLVRNGFLKRYRKN